MRLRDSMSEKIADAHDEGNALQRLLRPGQLGAVFHVAIYSGSRLLLSFVPLVLTPLVLRRYSPSDAEQILFAFGLAAFVGNVLSAWLEQVLYRFPLSNVGRPIRRVLGLQCIGVILVVGVSAMIPRSTDSVLNLLPIVAALGILDVIYRSGIVPVQMEGSDRAFIVLNVIRAGLEISFAIVALYLALPPVMLFVMLILGRTLSLGPLVHTSRFFHSSHVPEAKTDWWQYGVALLAWFVLLQLLQLGPQFFSVRYLDVNESTAFLASYRLYSSAGLLLPGAWLLYLHPKLLGFWRNEGGEAFNRKWIAAFDPYLGITAIIALGIVITYPLTSHFLLSRYAQSGWITMVTIPGVFCWSIANLMQKFHEVTNRTGRMALHLGMSVAVFAGMCWLPAAIPVSHRTASSLDIAAAFSIAFAVYLSLLAADVLRMKSVASNAVLRRVRLTLVFALVVVGSLITGLLAFHLGKWQ
jgi:hypothetical protein